MEKFVDGGSVSMEVQCHCCFKYPHNHSWSSRTCHIGSHPSSWHHIHPSMCSDRMPMLLTLLVTTCVPFVITAFDAVAACAFLGRVDTSAGLFTNTLYTLVNIDKYCIVFTFIIYSLLQYCAVPNWWFLLECTDFQLMTLQSSCCGEINFIKPKPCQIAVLIVHMRHTVLSSLALVLALVERILLKMNWKACTGIWGCILHIAVVNLHGNIYVIYTIVTVATKIWMHA